MYNYQVAEKFISINGEGTRAGEPAVFIRFKGCNLNCTYCDTKWANGEDSPCTLMTTEEICDYVRLAGIRNVTITGGEPLKRGGMAELISAIMSDGVTRVEIETNGSVDLSEISSAEHRPSFTMDYKLPESGMESAMLTENFSLLCKNDTVKFVSSSISDMERALEIIRKYSLIGRVNVYFSPVFGKIDPKDMVDFILKNKLNDVRLQIQLHKVIWDPDQKGV